MMREAYELERELARGGMGVVWIARDRALGRRVALKQMLGGGEPEDAARAVREGEALARLQHANVVRVYASGHSAEGPWLAMELVEGESLQARIERGVLGEREAVELVVELARGLEHAHEKGILHRDLKPDNVLISREGVPKLTDFGLAKVAGARRLTQSGVSMGTPGYMAPEQAAGEDVDARTDVYGLGAVLYAALSGRAPFVGATALGVMTATMVEEVARLEEVDGVLWGVVARSLAKSKGGRFATVGRLREDLERWLRGEAVEARAPGGWERLRGWVGRRRWVVGLAAGLGVAGVGVGVGVGIRAEVEAEVRLQEGVRVSASPVMEVAGWWVGGAGLEASFVGGEVEGVEVEGEQFVVRVRFAGPGEGVLRLEAGGAVVEEVLRYDAVAPALLGVEVAWEGGAAVVRGRVSERARVWVGGVEAEVEGEAFRAALGLEALAQVDVRLEDSAGWEARVALGQVVPPGRWAQEKLVGGREVWLLPGRHTSRWVFEGGQRIRGLGEVVWEVSDGPVLSVPSGEVEVEGVHFRMPAEDHSAEACVVVEGGALTLRGCGFALDSLSGGVGLWVQGGRLEWEGGALTSRMSTGVRVQGGASAVVRGVRFEGVGQELHADLAQQRGEELARPRAVRVMRGTARLEGVEVERWIETAISGGKRTELLELRGCVVRNSLRAGLFMEGERVVLWDSVFEGNGRGGAWLKVTSGEVEGCTFARNGGGEWEGRNGFGLGVAVGRGSVVVRRCRLVGNADEGAWVRLRSGAGAGAVRWEGCAFEGNGEVELRLAREPRDPWVSGGVEVDAQTEWAPGVGGRRWEPEDGPRWVSVESE